MKLNKNEIKYIAFLLPFLLSQTVFVITSSIFADILLAFKLVVFIYFLIRYVLKSRVSVFDTLIFTYFLIWFVSVFLNSSDFLNYIKEAVVILTLVLMVEDARYCNFKAYLNALTCVLFFEFLANLVCAIVFPGGLWSTTSIYGSEATYMFLGLGNQITPMLLLAVMTLLIQFSKHNIRFCIIYAIILLGNLIFMTSATAIVGVTIMTITYIVSNFTKFKEFGKVVFFIIACIGVGIVIFRVQYLFSFIIENMLGKSLTMSNRTVIWDRALSLIQNSPMIGYGSGTLETVIGDRNAHCFFLQIVIQSGVVGLLCYIGIFYVTLKKCWKRINTVSAKIITSCICGYVVCCMTEVYSQSYLVLLLCFAFLVETIEKEITSS